MAEKIILVAETGSDIPASVAEERGIVLVPMHVSMGTETKDDGSFPSTEVCDYYNRTGKVPKTSGSTPGDFDVVFSRIRAAHPDAPILHLAYSAVTTCSYQSALAAAEEMKDVRSVDVKHVSVGQCAVVLEVADELERHPDMTLEEAAAFAEDAARRVQMCFLPDNLTYLRAGGRVSNAAALVGNLLRLKPCIEILDGKLIATKKYRGTEKRCLSQLISDYLAAHSFRRDKLYLIRTPGFTQELQDYCEELVRPYGFAKIIWIDTGCVITCHGGPGSFGIVGIEEH